jgi:hypothetical protein
MTPKSPINRVMVDMVVLEVTVCKAESIILPVEAGMQSSTALVMAKRTAEYSSCLCSGWESRVGLRSLLV